MKYQEILKHTKNNKKNVSIEKEAVNILDYFSNEDELDLKVKDIIVGKENSGKDKNINTKLLNEKESDSVDIINSNKEIIELIEN